MARANVPEFGKWDGADNVPYTVYFDKARKNRGGKMINPNDPGENPEMFPNLGDGAPVPPSRPVTRQEDPKGRGGFKGGPEQRFHMEDGDFRHSPARVENQGQRVANEPSYGRGPRTARSGRTSGGSDHGYEKSPLHPQQHGSTGSTGRTRIRQNRVDESTDKGAAVPEFGKWDPQSAENFTDVFEKIREERKDPGNSPYTPKHPSHSSQPPKSNQPKSCCFPW